VRKVFHLNTALLIAVFAMITLTTPLLAQMEADRPTPPGFVEEQTVFSRLEDAGTSKCHPDFDYVIALDHSINRVIESGITYVDLYTLYKVLTVDGCLELSSLRWNYDPRSSFIEVAEVNIIRNGEKISVPVDLVLDLPAPQHSIYWSDRIKLMQLPRLEVGDGIEVKAMRKGYNYALLADAEVDLGAEARIASEDDGRYIPPMAGHYFDIIIFQADVPVMEKKYVLELPKSKRLQSQIYNQPLFAKTDYTDDKNVYTWWGLNMPAVVHESRQPDEADFAAKVVITTAESWEQKSKWFYDVNKNQFEVTDDITAQVNTILVDAGVTNGTDLQKAKALNHWVAQNIRYSGQTMGEGEGFTLHPSDVLYEYRSGVCKDIASLSITFLRAAGLDSYPAMTMAGSRIEDIPADQFNHCVVAMKNPNGEFTMLDPTWVPYNNDVWSKLETEQHYVIGHPDGVYLGQIRYSPPEESPLTVVHNATLNLDGTLSGTIRFDGSGALDSRLRRITYNSTKKDIENVFAGILANVGEAVEITRLQHRGLMDFTGDMWMEIDYVMPDFAMTIDNGLEFKALISNSIKDHAYLFRAGAVDWDCERENDVFLYYTQRVDITENIKLPRGYKLVETPEIDAVDEMYAAFTGSVTAGKTITISTLTDVRRRQIPPSGYAGFKKALDQLDEWSGTCYRITKGGAK
jgi:Domain of Unknown Function with PDB structure (DUF3857)/Transglutaminase-like superfamily